MFVTSANSIFALDARTGRKVWESLRPVTEGLVDDASAHHNRGVAPWHTRLFMETDNAHLLCIDIRSGHLIWDVAYAHEQQKLRRNERAAGGEGKVLVGTRGATTACADSSRLSMP